MTLKIRKNAESIISWEKMSRIRAWYLESSQVSRCLFSIRSYHLQYVLCLNLRNHEKGDIFDHKGCWFNVRNGFLGSNFCRIASFESPVANNYSYFLFREIKVNRIIKLLCVLKASHRCGVHNKSIAF